MRCPHLIKWVISSCRALESPYTPSMFELEEYCTKKAHQKCPFFLKVVPDPAQIFERNLTA